MFKNTAGQEWVVFAFEDEGGSNPGEPVAADQAQITASVRIDGGADNAVDDTNPTVLAGGYYTFGITAAESNGDSIVIIPASSTGNVNVIGVPGAVYTRTDNSGVEAKIDLAQLDLDTITGTAGALVDDGTGAGQIALTGGAIDNVTLVATTTVSTDAEADIAAVQSDTDNIQTRLPTSLVGGRMDSDVGAISTSAAAADNLEESALAIIVGTSVTGTLTTTISTTNITGFADSELVDRLIVWNGGTADGQASRITAYANTNGQVTYDLVQTAPLNNDTFVIV